MQIPDSFVSLPLSVGTFLKAEAGAISAPLRVRRRNMGQEDAFILKPEHKFKTKTKKNQIHSNQERGNKYKGISCLTIKNVTFPICLHWSHCCCFKPTCTTWRTVLDILTCHSGNGTAAKHLFLLTEADQPSFALKQSLNTPIQSSLSNTWKQMCSYECAGVLMARFLR